MNIVLFDGSPKETDSTSAYLLKTLEADMLAQGHTLQWEEARSRDVDVFQNAVLACDALVLAFPLYVDSIPSHLLRVLEAMQPRLAQAARHTKVYAILNNGFFEARQNHIALSMIKLWCEKSGLTWGQGLAAGGGGMAQAAPMGYGPSKNMGKALNKLLAAILSGESGEDIYTEPNFPRRLYIFSAHMGWRLQAKANGVKIRGLHQKHSAQEG